MTAITGPAERPLLTLGAPRCPSCANPARLSARTRDEPPLCSRSWAGGRNAEGQAGAAWQSRVVPRVSHRAVEARGALIARCVWAGTAVLTALRCIAVRIRRSALRPNLVTALSVAPLARPRLVRFPIRTALLGGRSRLGLRRRQGKGVIPRAAFKLRSTVDGIAQWEAGEERTPTPSALESALGLIGYHSSLWSKGESFVQIWDGFGRLMAAILIRSEAVPLGSEPVLRDRLIAQRPKTDC